MKKILIQPSFTDRDTQSLSLYLNDLNKLPVLSREEEKLLFAKYKQGDKRQQEKLILHNLRFVVSIAKYYQNMGVLLEDLIQEGNIGLIRQLAKYNPSTELRFITYQVWWIKQQMMYSLSLYSRQIKLPQNRILELDRIYKYINAYEQENTYPPSIDEIAEYMNVDKSSVLTFMDLDQPILYLFDPISEDFNLIDTITNEKT